MPSRHCVLPALLLTGCVLGCTGCAEHAAPPDAGPSSTPTPEPTVEPMAAEGIFVYVANPATLTLDGFAVARSDGSLLPLQDASAALPGVPTALAIDEEGRFAYVGMRNGSADLAVYAVDPVTGALALVPDSEVGHRPHFDLSSITLAPSGRLAYIMLDDHCGSNGCACGVWVWFQPYAIDPESGRLTALREPSAIGLSGYADGPPTGFLSEMVVGHGRYLYGADRGWTTAVAPDCYREATLDGWAVDPATGRLHGIGGFDAAVPADTDPQRWLGVRPSGDYLYYGREDRTLVFRVDGAAGTLTRVASLPRIGPGAFTSTGQLYASSVTRWGGLQLYDVEADTGRLVPKADAFFGAEGGATAVEIDARDRFLFSASMGAGSISPFRIDSATGELRPGKRTILDPGRRSEFHLVAIANVR